MKAPPASCRLCFVEIEGEKNPLTSCTVKVSNGMIVTTDTPRIRRLQKTAFELLLSTHLIECKACPANKKCELQKIAKYLHVPLKQKRIPLLEMEIEFEQDHPFLEFNPYKCVLCSKCISVCIKQYQHPYLYFSKRGMEMIINFFGEKDPDKIPCGKCSKCVDTCPLAALTKKSDS